MSNPTISIKNLGPIKEIKNFEVKKFNLLIGENACGKSLLAKAVWLFNDGFMDDLKFFVRRQGASAKETVPYDVLEGYYSEVVDAAFKAYDDYVIEYHYTNKLSIKCTKAAGKVDVSSSDAMKAQVAELIGRCSGKGAQVRETALSYSAFDSFDYYQKILVDDAIKEQYGALPTVYIPDIRSFVANFDAMRLNVLDNPMLAPHANDVLVGDVTLKSFARASRGFIKGYKHLESKEYRQLMKGDVIKDGLNRLRFIPAANPKMEIPIADIGSGQKDLFPILLVLQSVMKAGAPHFLIIEEPESHHFPKLQKLLLDEIAKCVNATDSKVLITTHSAFVLSGANNLLVAHENDYKPLMRKKQFIDGKQLNAVKIHNGKCQSVYRKKHNLIDADYIENAYDFIADEFDAIIDSKPA